MLCQIICESKYYKFTSEIHLFWGNAVIFFVAGSHQLSVHYESSARSWFLLILAYLSTETGRRGRQLVFKIKKTIFNTHDRLNKICFCVCDMLHQR